MITLSFSHRLLIALIGIALILPLGVHAYSFKTNDRTGEEEVETVLDQKKNLHRAATSDTELHSSEDPAGRSLLRRYARAKYCPESLKRSKIPNFYEQCLQLAGKNASETFNKGYITDSAKVRRAVRNNETPAFKLLQQMIQQANDRRTRRENNRNLPTRPTSPVVKPQESEK